MIREFFIQDFIYNNGLVNLANLIKDLSKRESLPIQFKLEDDSLILEFDEKNEDELFDRLFNEFILEYDIVYFTRNLRLYFDEKTDSFIEEAKIDIKEQNSANDSMNTYSYKSLEDLGLTYDDIIKKYNEFISLNKKEYSIPYNKNKGVLVCTDIKENIKNYKKYLFDGKIELDSRIHTFEDGDVQFHDICKIPKDAYIDRWDAFIYNIGSKIQKYFNSDFHLFINANSLIFLRDFKKSLHIKDRKISFYNKKEEQVELNSNLDLIDRRIQDIFSQEEKKLDYGFYYTNFFLEFKLKFFIYLFSIKESIEVAFKEYGRNENLYNALNNLIFVSYENDATFKKSFDEYTKSYKIIKFFADLNCKKLCPVFLNIFLTIKQNEKENNKKEKAYNISKAFCQNILNFSDIRESIFNASYQILTIKDDKARKFNNEFFEFMKFYIENILKGENMNIYEHSKVVGDAIGVFCANIDSKDLLFKLRNVKNQKQLLSFFKEFEFLILKNEEKARIKSEFTPSLEYIITNLKEWEIARDYVAIYAITKYKAVNFKKNQKQGE
ncbi:hypothetical protein [Campylobacter geochelonis]|uniref:hypothetical protein n=1 Tax=Campylobacter geochelonis TaxID=1780362 RepID=UPI000770B61D|nr:hypothetical protein [Campylobacter geochelonis]CZE47547.1 Uncharacterised protein [Campylobacter geochelonis]